MSTIKKQIGKALAHMPELAEGLYSIIDDLEELKAALENHKHDGTTGESDADVTLKTKKEI
ncbi:MAG: hypothetical protein K0Q47_10 [Sedimentibacter sp.]|jgi:hypothetical protein|nr:hypothetical protein [Sedimentibacter sp.]